MAIDEGDDARRFRVRPEVLRAYAATIRTQSGPLREVGDALHAITVDRAWFGKLPQSGHLAEAYETHHHTDVAVIADLVTVLLDVAAALAATADRYSTVDGAAEDAFRAVGGDRSEIPGMRVSLTPSTRVPLSTALR